jgi:hypothetical protein
VVDAVDPLAERLERGLEAGVTRRLAPDLEVMENLA